MTRIPAPSRAPAPARSRGSPRRSGAGGTLLGIFIGLLLGLALAAGVAFFVTGGFRAYQTQVTAKDTRDVRDAAKAPRADADKPRFDFYKILPGNQEPKVQAERKADKAPDRALAERAADRSAGRSPEPEAKTPEKGSEAPKTLASVDPAAKGPTADSTARPTDRFWLQAGSFSTEPDAENLKARLALAGWEASVQQGILPDKTLRYRVRLGPFDNTDELNRIKGELGRRGFDVAVIKY